MKPLRVKTASSLLDLLAGAGFTKTKIKQLLKHRAITVNGKIAKNYDQKLSVNDSVIFDAKQKPGMDILAYYNIRIIYEDEAILIIDKPSGLLTIATESEKRKTAYYLINEYMKQKRQRVFIVHRLDRETSGLIVFAKTEHAKRKLQLEWKNTAKKYYAIVEGLPKNMEGKIESSLGETKAMKVYSGDHVDETRHAVTGYKVLRFVKNYALLEVILETGRKHQIRVHLSDIGCPVAGDKKYGAETNPINRIALHAFSLSIIHPVSGREMNFASPMPKSFNQLAGLMKGQ